MAMIQDVSEDLGAPAATADIQPQPAGYRRFAVAILMIAMILNFIDRQVINILAEPIKHELHLADWQIGVMSGLAFALLYTFAGIPIARLAETGDRPRIMAISMAVWSGFTALCGLAQSFVMLLAMRVGVGLGEAGLTPAAASLIVDYTPLEKRASTLAFYYMGIPLGSLIGLAAGGLIFDAYGWRAAFFIVGAPGVLFALVVAFALREPRRALKAARIEPMRATFGETIRLLWSRKTYVLFVAGTSLQNVVGYGFMPFIASFFLRNHAPQVAELAAGFGLQSAGFLGVTLGLTMGLSGAVGVWLGGQLGDLAARRDLKLYATVPAIGGLLAMPAYFAVFQVADARLALLMLIFPGIVSALWMGSVHSTQQSIVPPHMRATATAILLFILNLFAAGLGPVAVGLVSDWFARGLGFGEAEGIRWALTVSSLLSIGVFACFWSARKTIEADYASVR